MCDGCYALCVERPVCASNEWTRMNSLSKAAVGSGLGGRRLVQNDTKGSRIPAQQAGSWAGS